MHIRFRARKVILWGGLVLLAALGGGLWFGYSCGADSETLATLIREGASLYLRDGRLDIGQVRVRPLVGDVTLNRVALWQKVDGLDLLAVRIPWLHVRHDTAELFRGRLVP